MQALIVDGGFLLSSTAKPGLGASGAMLIGIAIVAVAGTIGLFVLWQRLHPEDPVGKRRHLRQGRRDALKHWDDVQRDRAAGRWWKG
ncbi:MAG TPA: hypothetical protein VKX16_05330 [Chloroflexota bacterium]|nr:hypothetical protein [Chloroflexota bacterium]